ncbi:xanthine dehydrogenase family protein molybdopterin-binding subunit [Prauserella oleivorans]|uniref:Xanthine dehydrogenase family protein molybdopterin-binding subunit n=1 Tax=Prauserella oleivorans TaxID=1478153 RepID=A0ABW5WC06_9PSEU
MTDLLQPRVVGTDRQRVDGVAKVTGRAPYTYEHRVDRPAYLHPIQTTIARGRVVAMRTERAEATDGVIAVLTPFTAPRLETGQNPELEVLQSTDVAFRGQLIGAVIAETPEVARHAAGLVEVEYDRQPHDTELRADRDDLYAPDVVNPNYPTDTAQGDLEGAFAEAAHRVDQTYTTAMYHNNPMEPHTTIAVWDADGLTLYDSTQGVHSLRKSVAALFGLDPERVRVISPYVGGGFGSKGTPHANTVLAALAAKRTAGRPVKYALTRQQMFAFVGYRTPTIQRIRLAADSAGRLTAIGNDVVEQTSRIKEFAEQTGEPTRHMYAAPNRSTTHRLAALDVSVPSWMRAPGECPGMFAPEVALDELAHQAGIDPVELRVRNEPGTDPESGLPFSSRHLVDCLREGARRFDWDRRPAQPRATLRNGWWIGTGVASSIYPARYSAGSAARVRRTRSGHYEVGIGAADIGTGAWTVLTQIAADALGVDMDEVELQIGDSRLPTASVAGGSSGTANWGAAIVAAARAFRDKFGTDPGTGDELTESAGDNPAAKRFAMHGFGAQFAEVHVNAATGEVRVPRLLGVFATGRIANPRLARSQFIGGMTMGLSMALHEESVTDHRFGFVVNHDLAEYHIASCADVKSIEAHWLDEHDPYVNPMGTKGIGEIGIVGTAAAIANAAWHATGVRVRELPVTADKFLV